jgi:integrase
MPRCGPRRPGSSRGSRPEHQLAEFLGSVNDDRCSRCGGWPACGGCAGELCGLRWSDLDLDRGVLTIERNRITVGYQVVEGDPKTPAGRRAVALDKRSVQIHRRYGQDRKTEAVEKGKPCTDTGYVFTRSDGLPINPNYATTRFRRRAHVAPT